MKITNKLLILIVFGFNQSIAQKTSIPIDANTREIHNTVFKSGEYLKYRIHYGFINAGIAELKVEKQVQRQNRPVYHMIGTGRTTGMAEWFFKTRDRYETFMDVDSIIPLEFIRDVNEGGFKINRHIIFDHKKDSATDLKDGSKSFAIYPNSQDLLSTFYYARCIDTRYVKVGDEIPVNMFLDHEMYSFYFKYLGTETISSDFGKIRCKKFVPIVQEGRVFSEKEGMTLWVSDDGNRVPIRLETELAVGSIAIDLVKYSNLRHPLQFRK